MAEKDFGDTQRFDDMANRIACRVADEIKQRPHECVFEKDTVATLDSFAKFWSSFMQYSRAGIIRMMFGGVAFLILLGLFLIYVVWERQ